MYLNVFLVLRRTTSSPNGHQAYNDDKVMGCRGPDDSLELEFEPNERVLSGPV